MKRLICYFKGHAYVVSRRFTAESRQLHCPRCGGFWAMNDRVHVLVPWSLEFDTFYREFGDSLKEKE